MNEAQKPKRVRDIEKKCPYCGSKYYTGDMCATCYSKKGKVHELWLLCQEIKKRLKL